MDNRSASARPWPGKAWKYVLPVLTLVFIWGHSCVPIPESREESARVAGWLTPFLELFVGGGNVTDHLVRKLAHFAEFAFLGFQIYLLRTGRKWRDALLAVELSFFAAFLDESIQMLSGRGDQIIDVWLDLAGAVFGVLAAMLISWVVRGTTLYRE
ncbi:MAG: VanZ family protein [Oscillospiraceae bacterium]|nr:VanZ family protein [Oscillospiraceae bacterium]